MLRSVRLLSESERSAPRRERVRSSCALERPKGQPQCSVGLFPLGLILWFTNVGLTALLHLEQCSKLSLNHLGHSEKCAISVRGLGQRVFLRQRLSQPFGHVFATGVRKSLASLRGLADTVAIRNLCHRFYFRRIQLVETFDVIKNRIQVAQHAGALFS